MTNQSVRKLHEDVYRALEIAAMTRDQVLAEYPEAGEYTSAYQLGKLIAAVRFIAWDLRLTTDLSGTVA